MPTTTSPLTTPRSGFVQLSLYGVIMDSANVLCVSLEIILRDFVARRSAGGTGENGSG
jgi:hypothetical protein